MIHRGHQDHLPVCFHGRVNQRLKAMTGLSETHLTDGKGNRMA